MTPCSSPLLMPWPTSVYTRQLQTAPHIATVVTGQEACKAPEEDRHLLFHQNDTLG